MELSISVNRSLGMIQLFVEKKDTAQMFECLREDLTCLCTLSISDERNLTMKWYASIIDDFGKRSC